MVSGAEVSFSATYDRTTKIISSVVATVLLVLVIATQSIVIAILGSLLLLLSFAYSPRRFAVLDRSIMVHRLIGSVRIPLDGVREVRPTRADDYAGALRLWGNGGLFGYYGLFRTTKLGKCWWYVTNRSNPVVVVTERKTALFSPDDVDRFLAAIRAAVPVPPPASPSPEVPRSSRRRGLLGRYVGPVVVVVLILFIAVFSSAYSPGPPHFTLTATTLTIHDRFYPVTVAAASVDVERIQVVDIGTGSDWRPTVRTNGFSNGHYHSGWFRVANGQTVRMYWAESKRLILLPPKGNGTAVLVEVREPEAFVNNVQQTWFRP